MSGKAADAVIVGCGIVGAACADELAGAGLSVIVIEAGAIGGGATAAAMGHIALMNDSEPQFALTRYSQKTWRALSERLPADVEWNPCGAIWVAADQQEMDEVRHKHRFFQSRQVPAEVLDAQALADAEPNLRAGLQGALLLPEDAVINPLSAARFLMAEAQLLGAELLPGRRAVELQKGGVSLDDGSFISAGAAVIANGISAARLLPDLPLRPRKGHLLIRNARPGFVNHQLIELGYLKSAHELTADSVAFNVQPRSGGQVLIGSSRQFGSEDPAIDRNTMNAMISRSAEYIPGITGLPVDREWTGFRAATPDKLPLIGPHAHRAGVWIACGHEGLGITTSLGTARLVLDQILGRGPSIAAEPFFPARFA